VLPKSLAATRIIFFMVYLRHYFNCSTLVPLKKCNNILANFFKKKFLSVSVLSKPILVLITEICMNLIRHHIFFAVRCTNIYDLPYTDNHFPKIMISKKFETLKKFKLKLL
jgi:hypothetical protein